MLMMLGNQSGESRVAVNLTISGNTNNYNIFNNKGASYVAGSTDVTLTINSSVRVGSGNINSYALDTGTGWTAGDTITIINNGFIRGKGGNGGNGQATASDGNAKNPSPVPSGLAGNGQRGGHGLRLQFATTIQNNGSIHSGGGGGGGSAAFGYLSGTIQVYTSGAGGGGGAGRNIGTGGAGGSSFNSGTGGAGNNGSFTAGGLGGNAGTGRYGGNGGGPGAAGQAGQAPLNWSGGDNGAGGGKGNYITGNSFATWSATGTRGGNVA